MLYAYSYFVSYMLAICFIMKEYNSANMFLLYICTYICMHIYVRSSYFFVFYKIRSKRQVFLQAPNIKLDDIL